MTGVKAEDLILLNADPFEDIRNTREIWKVIKNGEIVYWDGKFEWAKRMQNPNYMSVEKAE